MIIIILFDNYKFNSVKFSEFFKKLFLEVNESRSLIKFYRLIFNFQINFLI